MITRRNLLLGSLAAGLAPAIITTPGLLMPVRKLYDPLDKFFDGRWVTVVYKTLDGAFHVYDDNKVYEVYPPNIWGQRSWSLAAV